MPDIALILFDLNGVLYRYQREARIAHLAALSGRTPDAIRTAIWESGFEDDGDAGAFDAADYLRGFGRCMGYAVTEDEWLAAQRVAISPMAESLALLPRLRPGVGCAVLTNNNLLVRRHFTTLYPEVAALVGDRAYVSAEFGARKPDPEVYRSCLAVVGVEPAATLFIDDSRANVAGAGEAELSGYEYAGRVGLEAELLRRRLLT